MNHEGPTNITSTSRTCGLCKFHRQHMLESGQHPEYKHFCGHPVSVAWQSKHCRGFLHWHAPDEDGREIGDTDNTPEWCPVVAEKLNPPDDNVRHGCNPFAPEALRGQPPEVASNLLGGAQPRLTRREVLVPSYVLPQHHRLYTMLARKYLAKHPIASALEVEQKTREALEAVI